MVNLKFEELRTRCRVLMVFAGMDVRGGQKRLSAEVGIDTKSLNYALCGTRQTEVYYDYLVRINEHLKPHWPKLKSL